MNKNQFRIIFNQARGLMMAVPEHVKSHSSGSSLESPTSKINCSGIGLAHTATIRPLVFSILLSLGMVGFIPNSFNINEAQAGGVVADQSAPANQRPIVTQAANGVPLVNIQAPSAAGVSRNTYRQFDVSNQGVILNNSRTNVQTLLGGFVQGNPYMAAGTARVILNEVNSSNPSLLNGYVEVAGSRAQVVIANPAGISCNGCGFINANRVTLTTGTPLMNSGDLIGYRVTGGEINFLGTGLDTSQSNYTDIIARAVHVNAGVFADNLNVITGSNQVNVASLGEITSIAPITGSGVSSTVALDVAALGGMYAGKIHLIGTEAGLGVTNAGTIGASVGEVTIDVDGQISNTGMIASTSKTDIVAIDISNTGGTISAGQLLKIKAHALSGNGKLLSESDAEITLVNDFNHTGELQANGNLTFTTAGTFINYANLVANNQLELNAQNVENTFTGEISALTTILNVSNRLTNYGLIDGDDTFINADTLINNGTGTIFGDQLALSGTQLTNASGAAIAARDRLDIGMSNIENRSSSLLFSTGDMAIGGSLDANHQAVGSATSVINENAIIETLGNITLASTLTQNLNGGLETEFIVDDSRLIREIQAEGRSRRYDISFFPTINNFNIELQRQVNAEGQTVDQFEDYSYFQYTATTSSTHLISSLPGQILSGGNMTINGDLINSDSRIIAG